MIRKIADNIISPLGFSTEANYAALLNGESMIRRIDDASVSPEAFTASMFTDEQWKGILIDGYTRFESLAIRSISSVLAASDVDVTSSRTILVVSTTKGNIELIDVAPERTSPAYAAQRIADYFGVVTTPLVACNACISGVSALIAAQRVLDCGAYDTAIVCGADVLSKFTISGFQSLKAMSEEPCRPFDMERLGLNLGEAAATVILQNNESLENEWQVVNGAICNDGFHITNPSPKGVGSEKAIRHALGGFDIEMLALVNAHGTATMFNDQMESKAIEAAGVQDIPVNALKGYYGHTMGAAGVLETIITMKSLDNGIALGTRGYEELGVSGKIRVVGEHENTGKKAFLKMISGFGGCNGALFCTKDDKVSKASSQTVCQTRISHSVHVTETSVTVDGKTLETVGCGKEMLTYIYKKHVGGDYSKFYKMDMLTRVGFVASELLLLAEGKERFTECDNRAVILFNQSSSICADREYNKSICDKENYYPSPSVFVYTLPNIVTGEIAIRNKYHGETSFYIMPEKNEAIRDCIVASSLNAQDTDSVVCGWINADNEKNIESTLYIIEKIK